MSSLNHNLPESWVVIRLGDLKPGRNESLDPRKTPDDLFEVYSVPAFPNRKYEVLRGSEIGSSKQKVVAGTVLLCGINPRINRVWVVAEADGRQQIASTEWVAFKPTHGLVPAYLRYFLQRDAVRDYLASNASGVGGSLMRVKGRTCAEIEFPLAPLAEQMRIVEEIEKQTTRIDAAEAALKRIAANLKRYRAAVLKAACEGRLVPTEAALARRECRSYEPASVLLERILAERRHRWEKNQQRKFTKSDQETGTNWKAKYKVPVVPDAVNLPQLPKGWCWATLDQLSVLVTSGSRGWKEYYSAVGALFIRSQDIRTDRLQLTKAARVRPPESSEGTRTAVRVGDMLVTITGANVAKAALVDVEVSEAYVSQHVGLIRFVVPELGTLIHLYATAPSGGRKLLLQAAYGAGKPGLNLDNLRGLPVPIPPTTERGRIIGAVEAQLTAIAYLEGSLDKALKAAQALRQSILKSAFDGKLVPQDKADEPASILLERIRSERDAKSSGVRPRRQRKEVAVP